MNKNDNSNKINFGCSPSNENNANPLNQSKSNCFKEAEEYRENYDQNNSLW